MRYILLPKMLPLSLWDQILLNKVLKSPGRCYQQQPRYGTKWEDANLLGLSIGFYSMNLPLQQY